MIFNINATGQTHSIMNNLSTPIKLFWSDLNAGKGSALQVDHLVVSEVEISEYQILSTRNIFYSPEEPKIINQRSGLFYREPNSDSFLKIYTWNAIIRFSNPKMEYVFNYIGTFNWEMNGEEISFEYVNVKMESEEKLCLTLPGLEYEPENEILLGYCDGRQSDIDSFIPKATVTPPADNCDDPDCDFDHNHSSASHSIANVFLNLLIFIIFYLE